MVSAVEEIREAYAEAFDAEREVLTGKGAKLLFLDPQCNLLREQAVSWKPDFSYFYGSTVFLVAEVSQELSDAVRTAAYLVVIDSDDPSLNNALHAKGDSYQPPLGDKAFWTIPAARKDELYTP